MKLKLKSQEEAAPAADAGDVTVEVEAASGPKGSRTGLLIFGLLSLVAVVAFAAVVALQFLERSHYSAPPSVW
jgi:hypothetical protein